MTRYGLRFEKMNLFIVSADRMGIGMEAGRAGRRLLQSSRQQMTEIWTRQVVSRHEEKWMDLELCSGSRYDIQFL